MLAPHAAFGDKRDSAYDVLQAIQGLVIGDKGYLRPQFQANCATLGIDLQAPVRQNMKKHRPGGSNCYGGFASASKPSAASSNTILGWRKPEPEMSGT